jgi:hypothetical protein
MVANIEAYPVTVFFNAEEWTMPTGAATVATIRQDLKALMNIPGHARPRLNGTVVQETAVVEPQEILEFVVPWGSKGGGKQKQAALDLRKLFPMPMLDAYSALGRHDWIGLSIVNDKCRFTIDFDAVEQAQMQLENPVARTFFREILIGDLGIIRKGLDLASLYCYSRAVAFGPKVLQPSLEQCVALENTELRIPFAMYKQPFPSVIVEFPKEYRQIAAERYGVRCAEGVIACHDAVSGCIVLSEIRSTEASMVNIMIPTTENSIEESLRVANSNPELTAGEQTLMQAIGRVAINFSLLLTTAGVVNRGPSDPKEYQRLKRRAKEKNVRKASQARLMMRTMPRIIEFDQKVTFYEERTVRSSTEPGRTGSHTPKKPHWRRGHWRNQPVGPGRTESKLVFIPPVFIKSELFGGNLMNTRTTYSTVSKPSEQASLTDASSRSQGGNLPVLAPKPEPPCAQDRMDSGPDAGGGLGY